MEPESKSPSLDAKTKRALKARARRLKPILHVGKNGLSPETITQLARIFAGHDLVKVRLIVEDGAAAEELARRMAAGVGAGLVARIGKVAVLYKPLAADGNAADAE